MPEHRHLSLESRDRLAASVALSALPAGAGRARPTLDGGGARFGTIDRGTSKELVIGARVDCILFTGYRHLPREISLQVLSHLVVHSMETRHMTTDTKEDPARSESEATPRKTWSAPKLEIFGIWSETGAKGSAVTESSTTKNSS